MLHNLLEYLDWSPSKAIEHIPRILMQEKSDISVILFLHVSFSFHFPLGLGVPFPIMHVF